MKPKVPDDGPRKLRKLLEAPEVSAVDTPVYPDREDSPSFPLAFTHADAAVRHGGHRRAFSGRRPHNLPERRPRPAGRAFGAYLVARAFLARPAARWAGISVTVAAALGLLARSRRSRS